MMMMTTTADQWGRTHASKTHDKRHRSSGPGKTNADDDDEHVSHDLDDDNECGLHELDDDDDRGLHDHDHDDDDADQILMMKNRSMRNRKMQQTIEAMVKILGEMRQR